MPRRVLLCCSGSVAAVKVADLFGALIECGEYDVRVVVTKAALHFIGTLLPKRFHPCGRYDEKDGAAALPPSREELLRRFLQSLYTDDDEWKAWSHMGDAVLHVDLRAWAEVVVVAPMSANMLSKVVSGGCDDLVSCILRAWQVRAKPVIVAPAMNTAMWEHPVTAPQVAALVELFGGKEWVTVLGPVSKRLACGDIGVGAMSEVGDIVQCIGQVSERLGRSAET